MDDCKSTIPISIFGKFGMNGNLARGEDPSGECRSSSIFFQVIRLMKSLADSTSTVRVWGFRRSFNKIPADRSTPRNRRYS